MDDKELKKDLNKPTKKQGRIQTNKQINREGGREAGRANKERTGKEREKSNESPHFKRYNKKRHSIVSWSMMYVWQLYTASVCVTSDSPCDVTNLRYYRKSLWHTTLIVLGLYSFYTWPQMISCTHINKTYTLTLKALRIVTTAK